MIMIQDKETRQKNLLENMHFICSCEACQEKDEEELETSLDFEPLF